MQRPSWLGWQLVPFAPTAPVWCVKDGLNISRFQLHGAWIGYLFSQVCCSLWVNTVMKPVWCARLILDAGIQPITNLCLHPQHLHLLNAHIRSGASHLYVRLSP